MKEALEVLIAYLFDKMQLDCVSARAFIANEASHHLLLSLGFHQDGVIPRCVKAYRDVIYDDGIYSLLKEEWRK
jgi:RimJ/RimL family protein N-acetyltransferase